MRVDGLKILYRDRSLIAIHKPSGWTTYRESRDVENATDALSEQLRRKVFPVHRLDKGTCGILIFAFEADFAARLQRLFSSKQVEKTYWAVVCGPLTSEGDIRESLTGNKEKIPQPAHTRYRVRASVDFKVDPVTEKEHEPAPRRFHWVEASPRTGRYHQIRRHFKIAGAPIVGDRDYGKSVLNERFAARTGVKRILLSSVAVRFPHPHGRRTIEIRTTPDREFESALTALGLRR